MLSLPSSDNFPRPVQIVVIGGGHGLSALLSTLKNLPVADAELTAIVAMTDDGGSSGVLRRTRGILPPGDLRRCLMALSGLDSDWLNLLDHRFDARESEGLSGHSVGNLLLAALFEQFQEKPAEAVRTACRLLRTQGTVLPMTTIPVELEGFCLDGRRIRGEVNVARAGPLLRRVALEPADPPAAPGVLSAITTAHTVLIGPGSLYTSVLPPLLTKEVAAALRRTKARVAYLCNPVTQSGETDGMRAVHHIQVLEAHLGAGVFRDVIVNVEPSTHSQIAGYVEPETTLLREKGYTVHRGRYWSFAMGRTESTAGLLEAIVSFMQAE